MIKKLLQMLGAAVVIVVLLGGWRYFLESTRPPALKAWEACKRQILGNWAGAHTDQVTSLLRFTEDHFYSFGGESPLTPSTITTVADQHRRMPRSSASVHTS